MNSLFVELGLMDAPEKDTPPSHEMICLGVWINTVDMTLSVLAFRLKELQLELNTLLNKRSFTKREPQQLLGKLSYVSACVRPGKAFMSRLLNALRSGASSLGAPFIQSPMIFARTSSGGCIFSHITMVFL